MGNVVGVVLVEDEVALVELDDIVPLMVLFLEPVPDGAAEPDDDGALVTVQPRKGTTKRNDEAQVTSVYAIAQVEQAFQVAASKRSFLWQSPTHHFR